MGIFLSRFSREGEQRINLFICVLLPTRVVTRHHQFDEKLDTNDPELAWKRTIWGDASSCFDVLLIVDCSSLVAVVGGKAREGGSKQASEQASKRARGVDAGPRAGSYTQTHTHTHVVTTITQTATVVAASRISTTRARTEIATKTSSATNECRHEEQPNIHQHGTYRNDNHYNYYEYNSNH